MSESKKTKAAKPEAPGWLLENIAEASKNARKIYLLYIGFLAYCALTVVSTTDRQIVLNEPARLPIINVEVALNGFFLLSPLLAIGVFIYFQIYLNKLKRLTDDLRFNYAPVAQGRLYPGLLNFADELDKGFVSKIQRFIVNFSLWWSLPLVLFIISLWYIKKHDPVLSYVLAVIPALGTGVVILFWQHYASAEKGSFTKRHKSRLGLLSLVLIVEYFLIFSVIPAALKGNRTDLLGWWTNVDLSYQSLVDENMKDYKTLPWVDLKGVHLEGANLRGAILDRADLKGAWLLGANLEGAQLRGADLRDANLDSAVLEGAQLQGATLTRAQLRGTVLVQANLDSANLDSAQLQGATLAGAQLRGADLIQANLDSAHFVGAELNNANLKGAQLRGAKLSGAQLQGAELVGANLDGASLRRARLQSAALINAQLQGADLENAQLQSAFLSYAQLQGAQFRNADLDSADLEKAQLQRAYLSGAHLKHANLYDANLDSANLHDARLDNAALAGAQLRSAYLTGAWLRSADLRSADLENAELRGAERLTVEQLAEVKTLYKARLDSDLLAEIKKNYPHLLEDPEKITEEPEQLTTK